MTDSRRGLPKRVAPSAASVSLPATPFLYTLDQVAVLVGWSASRLNARTFYVGRTLTSKTRHMLEAFNLSQPDEKPDWRVSEHEFIRWLRCHGYTPTKEQS